MILDGNCNNLLKGKLMVAKTKKKTAKKKAVVVEEVEEEVIPVLYFYPPKDDKRQEFCKLYMTPNAPVEIVEQFGSHEERTRYPMTHLIRVRFVGQRNADLVSPGMIHKTKKG